MADAAFSNNSVHIFLCSIHHTFVHKRVCEAKSWFVLNEKLCTPDLLSSAKL